MYPKKPKHVQKPFYLRKKDVFELIDRYKQEMMDHKEISIHGMCSIYAWEVGWGYNSESTVLEKLYCIFKENEELLHMDFVRLIRQLEFNTFTHHQIPSKYERNPYDPGSKFTTNLFINKLITDIRSKRFTK